MGENHKTKAKVLMNICEEIHFQTYMDLLKQKKITWERIDWLRKYWKLKDYSDYDLDINRLKHAKWTFTKWICGSQKTT